jgi:hypothetical protein
MTRYTPPIITAEKLVNYKFGILAATAFYGPTVERSFGRSLLLQNKKADALARALPEPERTAVEQAFARFHDLQAGLHDAHGTEQ